jgi:hypothetical protein
MDIILDSNVFRADFTLRSKDIDILLDYLKKTKSYIVLPQIIIDEVKHLYSEELLNRVSVLQNSIKNLSITLVDEFKFKSPEIDISLELKRYELFLQKRLIISKNRIIPYKDAFLKEAVYREINRIKPARKDGQGFRDILIWLTAVEYCETRGRHKQLIFISNNTADFASDDKNTLHEKLNNECLSRNIKIQYYSSLRKFIEEHSVKINFISKDWIKEKIRNDDFWKKIIDDLKDSRHVNDMMMLLESQTGNDLQEYKVVKIRINEVVKYNVYEMLDGTLLIKVRLGIVIDAVFTFYPYFFNDLHRFKYVNQFPEGEKVYGVFDGVLSLTLTYKDDKVKEVEYNGVEVKSLDTLERSV